MKLMDKLQRINEMQLDSWPMLTGFGDYGTVCLWVTFRDYINKKNVRNIDNLHFFY